MAVKSEIPQPRRPLSSRRTRPMRVWSHHRALRARPCGYKTPLLPPSASITSLVLSAYSSCSWRAIVDNSRKPRSYTSFLHGNQAPLIRYECCTSPHAHCTCCAWHDGWSIPSCPKCPGTICAGSTSAAPASIQYPTHSTDHNERSRSL